jgi:FkbM family methyltransferase
MKTPHPDIVRCFVNENEVDIASGTSVQELVKRIVVKPSKLRETSLNGLVFDLGVEPCQLQPNDRLTIIKRSGLDDDKQRLGLKTLLLNTLITWLRDIKDKFRLIVAVGTPIQKVRYKQASLDFLASNARLRNRAFFAEKEPDTMKWLWSIPDGSVLWDVGANIGAVSLYAVKLKNISAVAMEPYHPNFNVLCQNISLNKLEKKVTALNVALSRNSSVTELHVSSLKMGTSGHSLGSPVNQMGKEVKYEFSQSTISTTIDELVYFFGLKPPHFLKIDVDGFEIDVLSGAKKVLSDGVVRELSVEIDLLRPGSRDQIIEYLASVGYEMRTVRGEEVNMSKGLPEKSGHCFNYIFFRDNNSTAGFSTDHGGAERR